MRQLLYDSAAFIDLKDVYHHVTIHKAYPQVPEVYGRGHVPGPTFAYGCVFCAKVFTDMVVSIKEMLHLLDVRLHQYLDDWFIPGNNYVQCAHNMG